MKFSAKLEPSLSGNYSANHLLNSACIYLKLLSGDFVSLLGSVDYPQTIVCRHRKENLKKCSLRGLESRSDFNFFSYPQTELPDLSGYLLLRLDAPPLSPADAGHGLFVLDATWRYAEKMERCLGPFDHLEARSLPSGIRTAYPRKQDDCSDPERGLASVEAIYAAYVLMGRDPGGLLDNYYWAKDFLLKNQKHFNGFEKGKSIVEIGVLP